MKISCTKENLGEALSLINGVTGKNINLPILNNVLIKADDNKVEFIATNLELAIIINIRAKIEESGSFTVPARTLTDYISLLPNETISLGDKENELIITCGKSSTKIKGSSAEDYPIIPALSEGKGYLILAESLKEGLNSVLNSTAKNDIRPELSGVFVDFNNETKKATFAATDSYRLAEKKVNIEQGAEEAKIIIPSKTASEIVHLMSVKNNSDEKSVRVLLGDNQIVVSYNNTQIISRLVEGQYPDYTQIIPKNFNTIITSDTEKFAKEMKAAGLFTTNGVNSVSLGIDSKTGNIEVSSLSSQTGEYHSELAVEVKGEDGKVLLNNRYVLDGIQNIKTPEIFLKIVNGDSACVLTPKGDESFLYIVMPIRQ